ncbi:MAG TPA: chemotaxis protein CheX [Pirellulales bacterium]|jgi:chemotaxis protein CheX|nr:chemotaxis protein CheX [Pirellulales bacterium]
MQFGETEIIELTQAICHAVLDLALEPVRDGAEIETGLAGRVRISGQWRGEVILESSPVFAQQAAQIMFAHDCEAASFDDMRDAIAELTNIVGGNLKSILPGPSDLSVPECSELSESRPAAEPRQLLMAMRFESDGAPLCVTVYQHDAGRDRNAAAG